MSPHPTSTSPSNLVRMSLRRAEHASLLARKKRLPNFRLLPVLIARSCWLSKSHLQEKCFVLSLNLFFFQYLGIYLWILINKVSNYRQILQLQMKTVRPTDGKFGSHFIDLLPIPSVSNFGNSCGLSSYAAFSSIFPWFFKIFVLAAYIPKRLFSRLLRYISKKWPNRFLTTKMEKILHNFEFR